MGNIGVGLPLGWDGATSEFFAYNRLGATLKVGDIGALDFQLLQTETVDNDLGKSDSGFANVGAVTATQGAGFSVICRVVDLNGSDGGDNELLRWSVEQKVCKCAVGRSAGTGALAAGARLFGVGSARYLDAVTPSGAGDWIVRGILLEALADPGTGNPNRVYAKVLFNGVDLGNVSN